jgi:hypothetical protein
MRAALIFVFALSLGGCDRPPTARLSVRRLDGPRPPQVVVRCLADGLKRPLTYRWTFSPGVKPGGWSAPTDEPALLLQLPDVSPPGGEWATCDVASDDKRSLRATASLLPPHISDVPRAVRARGGGDVVTVRGSGFGSVRGPADGVFLASGAGKLVAADHACAEAAWSEQSVSACVPPSLPAGPWQLRLQVGDELALATAPLLLTRAR